ncbi:hypothetical protein FRC02_007992 [Tulasnella sp. 418]|nr:hypothetical protein FRC02_007992 [Tulasnella sp. 418]
MIYHTIGSVPFDVVSNKTYHLSPDAKYVNIVSSFSKLGGRTTIESASNTTPYITVEAIWKTRSAKFHPTVPEFRDDKEFASITFYVGKCPSEMLL